MPETIPDLLVAAAERDPDGVWLRSDDGTHTFAAALDAVARAADVLTELGRPSGRPGRGHGTHHAAVPAALAGPRLGGCGHRADQPGEHGGRAGGAGGADKPRGWSSATPSLPSSLESAGVAALSELGVADVAAIVTDVRPPYARQLDSPVGPDDPAVLIPTSGTTGRSKLVLQTHRAYAWAGEGFPFWMQLHAGDRLMTSLPLFHINAQAYSTMGSLSVGAGLVLLPRFSASGFLAAARRHGATEFNAIGAMLEILMRQPERADDADTPLRLCYTGPSPTRERRRRWSAASACASCAATRCRRRPYGLIWPRGSRPFGTLGAVRQHPRLGVVNAARVVDADDRDLPVGATGELLLRNPVVTPGYWGMPDETAEAIRDGWLHTGDLVTRNSDQTFTFVARRKEVLRRRGENLSPAEVEDAVLSHPAVLECAVVGVPSELSEEDVKAFVVPRGRGGCRRARAQGLGGAAAGGVQGAAVLAGGGQPAADLDVAGRQAPAAHGAPGGRGRPPGAAAQHTGRLARPVRSGRTG